MTIPQPAPYLTRGIRTSSFSNDTDVSGIRGDRIETGATPLAQRDSRSDANQDDTKNRFASVTFHRVCSRAI